MTLVGQSIPRPDAEAKARGTARFAIDYEEPRLLHAKLVRSPLPSGRIIRIDTTRAEAMPGVRAIVTGADAPGSVGFTTRDQTLLARDVVRCVGEPIAAVAAETVAQARAAASAIEVELEPLPAVTDVQSALAAGAPLVHEAWESYPILVPGGGPRRGNVAWEATVHHGDLDAAFAREDVVVVEDEFEAGRQHQASIEPRAAVARYENGRFTIHSSTQWLHQVRLGVAEYLGVRPADVRVIATEVGGGFGGKLEAAVEALAALLARKAGRPVKLVNTRRDEFVGGNPRESAVVRLRSAVTREGEILAREAVCLMDAGAYCSETGFIASAASQVLAGNYRVVAFRLVAQAIYTNTPPTGAFRGVSGTYCAFALERHMDHIAEAIGMDRRELRLRTVIRDGDLGPTGQKFDDVALLEGLERIEAVAPWAEVSRRRPYRGVGIACTTWVTNAGPGSVTLKLNEDGTVGVITAAVEIGSGGLVQGVTQVVAESLGLRPEDVVLMPADTDAGAYDMGAAGSRTTVAVGNAARLAAEDVRRKALQMAAGMLEASPDDLELAEGQVRVVGAPERAVPLAMIALAAVWTVGPITGQGSYNQTPAAFNPACSVGNVMPVFSQPSFHVHLCEVEVDPDTGKVTVLRYVVAQDVGRALNPAAVVEQIRGGVVQGLGYALYESLRLDDRGRYLEDRFETYRLPTALEAPPLEAILIEGRPSPGPFGAKGVAEPPIVPVAAVVGCAVADAIGRPVSRLPLTPWTVLEAMSAEPSPAAERASWSWREATIADEPVIAASAAATPEREEH